MFTFSKLNKYGRLGNQLFQIAATIAIARKHGVDYCFPEWPYAKYFDSSFPQSNEIKSEVNFYEPQHHYADYILDPAKNIDIHGYFQSEKFWDVHPFGFTEVFSEVTKAKNQYPFENACAVHIRRGDYIGNDNYVTLPVDYYYRALQLLKPHQPIIVFSDDAEWCKENFKPVRQVIFSEGNSDIEDLCLMSCCRDFIISNSTFAWWGAYLGNSEGKVIIAPDKWYAGKLAQTHSEKDVVPSTWMKIPSFAPIQRIDLTDVTFTIPVKFDHQHRIENLELTVQFLQKHFDTNIMVMEMDNTPHFQGFANRVDYVFEQNPSNKFERTRMLNKMAIRSKTPIIANWDADVLIDPDQILKAVQAIREKKAVGVYPYDGRFYRASRGNYAPTLKSLDLFLLKCLPYPKIQDEQISVGGAILWDKQSFIEGGMENQNMISYGPEDYERFERFKKLGYKLARVKGPLYHIDHYVGPDSSDRHSDFKNNEKEYFKIKSMSQEELKQYVSTWQWAKTSGCKSGGITENGESSIENDSHPLLSLNFDKIYLVNLDRRPERLRHALHELSLAGIHGAERVSAVDGQALELSIQGYSRLTPGMIGCYQSHYRLITEAYHKGYESICVFEDDVSFAPGFQKYFGKAVKQLPSDWQFVYLGCNEHDGFATHKRAINKYWVVPNYVWGTQGFMIRTKEAFRVLHKQLAKQEMQIDEQLANIIFPTNQLKVYALFPTNMVSQVRPDGTLWESDVQVGKVIV